MGYYRDPEATAALIQNGWLHSGDLGRFDEDGYLIVTGRKKEILVTSGGKKTSPAMLEAKLRNVAPIGQALVVGNNRNHLVALLTLDPEKVEAFAERHHFGQTASQLLDSEDFRRWLENEIERQVNATVSRFEGIKRFALLPNEFSIESGELTSTMKLRRAVCEAKYQSQIDALYAAAHESTD